MKMTTNNKAPTAHSIIPRTWALLLAVVLILQTLVLAEDDQLDKATKHRLVSLDDGEPSVLNNEPPELSTSTGDSRLLIEDDGFPHGYNQGNYKQTVYTYHYDDPYSHDDAVDFCKNLGGKLVCIESRGEQVAIQRLIRHPSRSYVWTAGKYFDDNCFVYKWVYPSGPNRIFYQFQPPHKWPLGYHNFWRQEPEFGDTTNHCVAIKASHQNYGKWYAQHCNNHYPVVCEWDECSKYRHNEHGCISSHHDCVWNEASHFCRKAGNGR